MNFNFVRTLCRRYRNRLLKRDEARKQLEAAIKERNLKKMENSLNNCIMNGIDESTILRAETVIDIVRKEDQLIEDVKEFLRKEDVENLIKTIEKFRYHCDLEE